MPRINLNTHPLTADEQWEQYEEREHQRLVKIARKRTASSSEWDAPREQRDSDRKRGARARQNTELL